MGSLRDLVPRHREPVLPRLTTARTVKAIAQQTGEDPSKIKARLDRERAKALGKRANANRHPVGTSEFALRHAVTKLGMPMVSALTGIGEAVLYKALNASDSARRLPDIAWSRMLAVAAELRRAGHGEFFSLAVQRQGDAVAGGSPAYPDLHHALTRASLAHGEVARAVVMATDPDLGGSERLTGAGAAEIVAAIAAAVEALSDLERQALIEARPGVTS